MSMDPRLEQAAQDLYATPAQTFLRVTLPLAAPGIAAGALLSFALSFDDYIITSFNAGQHRHLPDVRLGLRAARHAGPGQRDRYGDVRGRRADRALRAAPRQPQEGARLRPGPVRRAARHKGVRTMDPARSLADAEPAPYWLDDPGRPRRRGRAGRRGALRPAGGRRRLQRAVDGAAGQGARPRPGRGADRGRPDRLGRLRPQRRLLRGQRHPRRGQRAGPLAGRVRRAPAARRRNLDAIEAAVARYGLDCDFERTGEIDVATAPVPVSTSCARRTPAAARHGLELELLDRDQVRAEVDSPTFHGGLYDRRGVALRPPGQARLGPEAGRRRRGRARLRAHPRPPTWSGTAPRSPCAPPTAGCSPTGSRWAPASSRRCSAGSARTPCRSTTTR